MTLAVDTAPTSTPSMLLVILPFVGAVVLALLAPLIAAKFRSVLVGQIANDSVAHRSSSTLVPRELAPHVIDDYLDYAADVVQVFPATLLPIVGAIYAFLSDVPQGLAIAILLVTVCVSIGLDGWVLSCSATDYAARRRFGYGVAPLVALLSNIVCIVLLAVFG